MSIFRNKKMIILDLDETIWHSTYEKLNRKHNLTYNLLNVYVRPNSGPFIRMLLQEFKVGIWTSAKANYAEHILKHTPLDFSKNDFDFFYTRKDCIVDESHDQLVYRKGLKRICSEFDLQPQDCLIIDDRPDGWLNDTDQLFLIDEYRGQEHDRALIALIKEMIALHQ